MRNCIKCGPTKNEFPKQGNKCKSCIASYKKQWDEDNREWNRQYKANLRKDKLKWSEK